MDRQTFYATEIAFWLFGFVFFSYTLYISQPLLGLAIVVSARVLLVLERIERNTRPEFEDTSEE